MRADPPVVAETKKKPVATDVIEEQEQELIEEEVRKALILMSEGVPVMSSQRSSNINII